MRSGRERCRHQHEATSPPSLAFARYLGEIAAVNEVRATSSIGNSRRVRQPSSMRTTPGFSRQRRSKLFAWRSLLPVASLRFTAFARMPASSITHSVDLRHLAASDWKEISRHVGNTATFRIRSRPHATHAFGRHRTSKRSGSAATFLESPPNRVIIAGSGPSRPRVLTGLDQCRGSPQLQRRQAQPKAGRYAGPATDCPGRGSVPA